MHSTSGLAYTYVTQHPRICTPSRRNIPPRRTTSPLGKYTFYPWTLVHLLGVRGSSRRSCSTRQGTNPKPPHAPATRKLGSKYLLLNLFRKAASILPTLRQRIRRESILAGSASTP